MPIYLSNNFRVNIKIMIDGEPYEIESSEFIKPGKGQAFTRVKLRRLLTGTLIEKTFKSADFAKSANVTDIRLTYLYNDKKFWYFMDKTTFEQLPVSEKIIGHVSKWLFEQTECTVTLWNGQPISINPPNFVELKVIRTDPDLKGATMNTNSKSALLCTGVIIKVPLFVQIGNIVKVDTRSGAYVARVK